MLTLHELTPELASAAAALPDAAQILANAWALRAQHSRVWLICQDDAPAGLLLRWQTPDGRVHDQVSPPTLRMEALALLPDGIAPATVTLRRADEDDLVRIAEMSADWEAEQNVYGYRANTVEALRGWCCWLALADGQPVGFCAGTYETQERDSSVIAAGTRYFELEELYVLPVLRSRQLGSEILRLLEPELRADGAQMLLCSAVNRDAPRLVRFYTDRAGMSIWSTRMYKKL